MLKSSCKVNPPLTLNGTVSLLKLLYQLRFLSSEAINSIFMGLLTNSMTTLLPEGLPEFDSLCSQVSHKFVSGFLFTGSLLDLALQFSALLVRVISIFSSSLHTFFITSLILDRML